MPLKTKFLKACSILRKSGVKALCSAVGTYLFARENEMLHPDESKIAFEVLNAAHCKGLMIDVGAHFGNSLSDFAEHGWRIYAFEPDSGNRQKLNDRWGNNPDVIIDPRALSDHSQEEVTFYRSTESSGISGMSAFHSSHMEAEKVAVTTLGEFIEEQNISECPVDFLKIDTEGYDLHVLKGFPWDVQSPRMIVCEFEDKKTLPLGYDFHELAQFLIKMGYQLIISEWCPITRYGGDHKWSHFSKYPCELTESNSWGNILAVKEDALYQSIVDHCKILNRR